jgi:DNA-binding HxlR family transcriptional regulator
MTNQVCTKTPVGITLKVIGGKWKLLILWHLEGGTKRFGELMRLMPGITQKMVTQELRELEDDGLIQRKVYPQIPPKVEYSMSTYGTSLCPVLKALHAWGETHLKRYSQV